METIICDISAFEYWRIPPVVHVLLNAGANPSDSAALASTAMAEAGADALHALSEERSPWAAGTLPSGAGKAARRLREVAPPTCRQQPAMRGYPCSRSKRMPRVRHRSPARLEPQPSLRRHGPNRRKRTCRHPGVCASADRRAGKPYRDHHARRRTLRRLRDIRASPSAAQSTANHGAQQAAPHNWKLETVRRPASGFDQPMVSTAFAIAR